MGREKGDVFLLVFSTGERAVGVNVRLRQKGALFFLAFVKSRGSGSSLSELLHRWMRSSQSGGPQISVYESEVPGKNCDTPV